MSFKKLILKSFNTIYSFVGLIAFFFCHFMINTVIYINMPIIIIICNWDAIVCNDDEINFIV